MAELSATQILLKENVGNPFYIARTASEDKLLFSSNERGVLLYCLKEKRILKSWPHLFRSRLTSKASFHVASQKYLAVCETKSVFLFDESTASLGDAAIIKPKMKNIAFLETFLSAAWPCVVFVSPHGQVAVANSTEVVELESASVRKEIPSQSAYSVLWCSAFTISKDCGIVMLFMRMGSSIVVRCLKLQHQTDSNDLSMDYCDLAIASPKECSEVTASCFCEEVKVLWILWNNKTLSSYDLGDHLRKDSNMVKKEILSKTVFSDVSSSPSKDSEVHMVAVGRDHLLITNQEESGAHLEVLETKFGTVVGSTSIPSTGSAEHIRHVCYHHGNVLLVSTSKLVHLTCTTTPSSLATSLGRMLSPSPMMTIGKLPMKPGDSGVVSLIGDDEDKHDKLLIKLLDKSRTPTACDFAEAIEEYLGEIVDKFVSSKDWLRGNDNKAHPSPSCDTSPSKKRKLQTKDPIPESIVDKPSIIKLFEMCKEQRILSKLKRLTRQLLPPTFIATILKHCLEDKDFWSPVLVEKFLQIGVMPVSICGLLVERLIKEKLLGLLLLVMKSVAQLPEICLVNCLRLVMRLNMDKVAPEKAETHPNIEKLLDAPEVSSMEDYFQVDGVSFLENDIRLICSIVCYKYNDVPMQLALKRLGASESRVLLLLLRNLVRAKAPLYKCTEYHGMAASVDVSYKQVLDFLPLLINANFSAFLLSPDLNAMLKTLDVEVKTQIRNYDNLQGVLPYLYHIEQGYKLPDRSAASEYKFERIRL